MRVTEILTTAAIWALSGTMAGPVVQTIDQAYHMVRSDRPAAAHSWESELMDLRDTGDPQWWKDMESLQ